MIIVSVCELQNGRCLTPAQFWKMKERGGRVVYKAGGRGRVRPWRISNTFHCLSHHGESPPRMANYFLPRKFHQLRAKVFFSDVIINLLINILRKSTYCAVWCEIVTDQVNKCWMCQIRNAFITPFACIEQSGKVVSGRLFVVPSSEKSIEQQRGLFCLGLPYTSAWAWWLVCNHLSME